MFTIIIANQDHYKPSTLQLSKLQDNYSIIHGNIMQDVNLASAEFNGCNIASRSTIYELIGCKEYDMDIAICNTHMSAVTSNTSQYEQYKNYYHRFNNIKCDILIRYSYPSIYINVSDYRHYIGAYYSVDANGTVCQSLTVDNVPHTNITVQERDSILMNYIHELIKQKYEKLYMQAKLRELTFAPTTTSIIKELVDENIQLKAIIANIRNTYQAIGDITDEL